jgi:hypothetical protein
MGQLSTWQPRAALRRAPHKFFFIKRKYIKAEVTAAARLTMHNFQKTGMRGTSGKTVRIAYETKL